MPRTTLEESASVYVKRVSYYHLDSVKTAPVAVRRSLGVPDNWDGGWNAGVLHIDRGKRLNVLSYQAAFQGDDVVMSEIVLSMGDESVRCFAQKFSGRGFYRSHIRSREHFPQIPGLESKVRTSTPGYRNDVVPEWLKQQLIGSPYLDVQAIARTICVDRADDSL